jgi:two-component system response regulator AtoC
MAKQVVPKPGFSGRGESLLICDDDPFILESLATLLRKQGYVVDTTADGAEAIAAFTKSSSPYDLVICDARMPYMDGISTLRALQAIRRSVRFLLMSGSGVPGDALVASPSGVVGFLPKPFEADLFLNRVAELLSRSTDEPSPRGAVACKEAAEGVSFHVI